MLRKNDHSTPILRFLPMVSETTNARIYQARKTKITIYSVILVEINYQINKRNGYSQNTHPCTTPCHSLFAAGYQNTTDGK